jgi:hypothetical protein
MSRLNSLKLTFFAVLALGIIAGCTSLKISKPNVWPFTSEDATGTPTRIVTSWTDTILYQPNQVPTRGFGGRLLFYSGEKPEPIKVDGTLTVYVFDETNRDLNNVRPDRKYVFTKEQLAAHYSKSKLGHSYSVWLPWDEVGGLQKELSLIARFTTDKGGVVVGEQTKQILPGTTQIIAKNSGSGAASSAALPATPVQYPYPSTQHGSVQPASYVMPLPPVDSKIQGGNQNGTDQSHGLDATTINLPPKSSLRNSLTLGNAAIPNLVNPTITPLALDPKCAPRTGVINTVTPSTGENQPAGYQANTAFSVGITASNPVSRPWNQVPQPYSQPNRFAPGQPQVPNASTLQPIHDPGQWQPHPSTPQFSPDMTPQPTTMENGSSPSFSKAGLIQN